MASELTLNYAAIHNSSVRSHDTPFLPPARILPEDFCHVLDDIVTPQVIKRAIYKPSFISAPGHNDI
jgi:hypothetical protein